LASAAVVAALGLAQGPAHGAFFAGTFDPTDFSGSFTLVLSNACLITDGWIANGSGGCTGSLNFVGASVTSTAPEPVYTGNLTFAPPAITSPSQLLGFSFSEGQLTGLDTTLIHHVTEDPSTDDEWWIQFSTGEMPGGNHPPCDPYCGAEIAFFTPQQTGLPSGVFLYAGPFGERTLLATAQYTGITQLVPEPGTLALLTGAMLTGWIIRRRATLAPPA
jgi:hypothetical protein